MDQQRPSFGPRFLAILSAAVILFLVGYVVGNGSPSLSKLFTPVRTTSSTTEFGLVDDVWGVLQQRYAGTLDKDEAIYGAIRGMVASLGDPYTVFFSPEEAEDFQNEIQGTFEGIGAEIGIKENQLVVIAPLPNSPAERAGLIAGDAILTIDSVDTSTLTLDEAVQKIRGKDGTTVAMAIRREGAEEPTEVSIVRAKITIESVTTAQLDGGIFHITLSYFGPNTAQDFQNAVNQAVVNGSRGVILDLRNDPGGYLDTAVEVASHFLASDSTVVIEEESDGTRTTLSSKKTGALVGMPAVVLIDKGSASGSEIVAGALQDLKAATIVGVTSYGKGSVQQIEELPDGSNLKVTIAKWLTPNGRSIHQQGITPDVVVDRTPEDFAAQRDPQLDRAIQILQEKIGNN